MAKGFDWNINGRTKKQKKNLDNNSRAFVIALKKENIKVTLELNDLNHEVVSRLRNEYENCKEEFSVQRYELLKTMIKEAIQASKPRYLGQNRNLADNATALRVREETNRALKAMKQEDIRANTKAKQDHIKIIRALETDYINSKGVFPLRRYVLMKRMVKRRTRQAPAL